MGELANISFRVGNAKYCQWQSYRWKITQNIEFVSLVQPSLLEHFHSIYRSNECSVQTRFIKPVNTQPQVRRKGERGRKLVFLENTDHLLWSSSETHFCTNKDGGIWCLLLCISVNLRCVQHRVAYLRSCMCGFLMLSWKHESCQQYLGTDINCIMKAEDKCVQGWSNLHFSLSVTD